MVCHYAIGLGSACNIWLMNLRTFVCHLIASSDMTYHVLTVVLSCMPLTPQYTPLQVCVENPDPELTLLYFLRNERILFCDMYEISVMCVSSGSLLMVALLEDLHIILYVNDTIVQTGCCLCQYEELLRSQFWSFISLLFF